MEPTIAEVVVFISGMIGYIIIGTVTVVLGRSIYKAMKFVPEICSELSKIRIALEK